MYCSIHMYDKAPYISWKGQTFRQVTSSIQKNVPLAASSAQAVQCCKPSRIGPRTRPNATKPLNIYRREIAIQQTGNASCSRSHVTIDEINRPGGSIVNTRATVPQIRGQVGIVDFNLTANRTERPGSCLASSSICADPASNALRRVRSAGMVRKNVSDSPVPKYFTNKQQYLANRSLGFQQNEFHFLRTGNGSVTPGTAAANPNTYSGNVSLSYCPGNPTGNPTIPSYYKPNNPSYAQQGGVSASTRSAMLKYATITTTADTTSTIFGPSTASALSYGTNSGSPNGVTYSVKGKIGYPNTPSPKFPPAGVSGPGSCCVNPPIARPL